MKRPRIAAISGSLRADSFNRKLLNEVARGAASAGGEVEVLDLRDFDLPLFDQDLEDREGLPDGVLRLKEKLASCQGLVIASPEYNGSISGVLKNALDWASRRAEAEPPGTAFRGKVGGLVAASPGALGGLRGLVHVRAILGNLGVLVLPDQVAVAKAHQAFDEDGEILDEKVRERVVAVGRKVVEVSSRLMD